MKQKLISILILTISLLAIAINAENCPIFPSRGYGGLTDGCTIEYDYSAFDTESLIWLYDLTKSDKERVDYEFTHEQVNEIAKMFEDSTYGDEVGDNFDPIIELHVIDAENGSLREAYMDANCNLASISNQKMFNRELSIYLKKLSIDLGILEDSESKNKVAIGELYELAPSDNPQFYDFKDKELETLASLFEKNEYGEKHDGKVEYILRINIFDKSGNRLDGVFLDDKDNLYQDTGRVCDNPDLVSFIKEFYIE